MERPARLLQTQPSGTLFFLENLHYVLTADAVFGRQKKMCRNCITRVQKNFQRCNLRRALHSRSLTAVLLHCSSHSTVKHEFGQITAVPGASNSVVCEVTTYKTQKKKEKRWDPKTYGAGMACYKVFKKLGEMSDQAERKRQGKE
eukprot:3934743-Rhodomonas_salina.1